MTLARNGRMIFVIGRHANTFLEEPNNSHFDFLINYSEYREKFYRGSHMYALRSGEFFVNKVRKITNGNTWINKRGLLPWIRQSVQVLLLSLILFLKLTNQSIAMKPDGEPFQFRTNEKWAKTGVKVIGGKHYHVKVEDMSGVVDWFIPVHDLNGWPWAWARVLASPIGWLRRRPSEPWFALIATVDGANPVRVQEGEVYTAPASGELIFYFNDTKFSYWNNYGTARLRILPTKEQTIAVSKKGY